MNPANKYIACVWKYAEGFRVTDKRSFSTDWGAVRFAERVSEQGGVIEVTVTLPCKKAGEWGKQFGSAKDGKFTFTNKETTMSKKKDQDDGGEKVASTSKRKAKGGGRAKRERVTSKLDWGQLLDLSDLGVRSVDMKYRPALPKGVAFEDNFCDAYARFLSGDRRTHPGSQKRGLTEKLLEERREYVRRSIAQVEAGKAQAKPKFTIIVKGELRKKSTKPKASDKPKQTTTRKPSTSKPKTATQKKADAKKAEKQVAAKKEQAKAAAAARSRGASVKVRTSKAKTTKKRGKK